MADDETPRRAKSTLQVLAEFDAELVDGLLVRLSVNGAEKGSILVRSWPDGSRHGLHVVQWRQDGRDRTTEGHTALTALRRAVEASGAQSAKPSGDPETQEVT